MTFNTKAFALASGLIYAFVLFITTWWLIIRGYSNQESFIGMIYPCFTITPLGSFLALVYGFFDGIICGALFAWLYNHLAHAFGSRRNG